MSEQHRAPAESVQPGQILELRIESLAHGGAGIARHQGQAVFIRHTAPGDLVRAEITELGRRARYALARPLEILEPGPGRRPHPWPAADPLAVRGAGVEADAAVGAEGESGAEAALSGGAPRSAGAAASGAEEALAVGGADYGHLHPWAQREAKARVLRDQLTRLGGLPEDHPLLRGLEIEPAEPDAAAAPPAEGAASGAVPAGSPGTPAGRSAETPAAALPGWRTRVHFAVTEDGTVGMHPYHREEIIPVPDFPLATDRIRALGLGRYRWPGIQRIDIAAPEPLHPLQPRDPERAGTQRAGIQSAPGPSSEHPTRPEDAQHPGRPAPAGAPGTPEAQGTPETQAAPQAQTSPDAPHSPGQAASGCPLLIRFTATPGWDPRELADATLATLREALADPELGTREPDQEPVGAQILTAPRQRGSARNRWGNRRHLEPVHLCGPDSVTEAIFLPDSGEIATFRVGAGGFWQIHRRAPQLLAEAVARATGLRAGERAWDLYGGAGLFARVLQDQVGPAGEVWSVEGSPVTSADARRNLPGVRCTRDDVAHALAERASGTGADVVVLDPPRQGAGREVIEALCRPAHGTAPRRIVYVSCDPAALGRDTGYLRERGWEPTGLRALDLYPDTHHLESVAVFEPRGNAVEQPREGGR